MSLQKNNLNRADKILLFLYEFGKGKIARVRYEDIVVGVFKKYPVDFQLKGYPQYPDSGDLIHKPLYNFKKKGFVNAENKVFSLTERGVEFAASLNLEGSRSKMKQKGARFSRSTEIEISRIKNTEGFALFVSGKEDSLSDGDFYTYLGVTVRTRKNAFIGRLNTIGAMIEELEGHNDSAVAKLKDYNNHLMNRYKEVVEYFMQK